MNYTVATLQSAERQVMRLYENWPARRHTEGAGRARGFFTWLLANYSRFTEYGVFGDRDPHQHIGAITARWEGTYGRVERLGSK